MASTSASAIKKCFNFDVFISFRGEDVRKTFVDHLFHALHNRGITTYKDDEKIEKGKRINDQLMRSIEDSRFHIIVFSKNYASSSWCLDELVKIMECQRMTGHTAYPVFYDVEPTEVRNQSGAVEEAFKKHVGKEVVGRWRDALKEASGLAGWELKNTLDRHEAQLIRKIIEEILPKIHLINLSVDENLVGMVIRVKEIVSSLEIGSDGVRMIGIKGIGGGGKTTLATNVFEHISLWFDGASFVENVREVSKSSLSGLKELQQKVLSEVLNDKSIVVNSVSDGRNKMKRMIGSKKVLVVLDDVDHVDQLEALACNSSWFKSGSRIIITTRDEQVLRAHRVHSDDIHDVNLLSHKEAICLFSRYAFKSEIPNQGYTELSRKVVLYASGLPLTIKVLGSHLSGRSEPEWLDVLERLKTIPLKETLDILELSYNGLEDDHKDIFLDVACLWKGMKRKRVIRILKSCGYHAEFGLRVLEQKSLLSISNVDYVILHDHLEEMGRNIVRRLHPDEPNKHTRLWIKEEIEDILINESGTEAIRGIKLECSNLRGLLSVYTKLHPALIMKGLTKMTKLRFLYVDGGGVGRDFEEVGLYLPNTLQFLYWPFYPFRCLPKTFQANKLINLDMAWSNISELWEGQESKENNKLIFLNLAYSKLRTFDLGMTPNLEKLALRYCNDFVELRMHVNCPKLKFLKLSGSKVSNLNLDLTPNLEGLYLDECNDFVELYMLVESPKLKFLTLSGSKVSNLNLGLTPNLEELYLDKCNDFVELYIPIECPKLKFLNLSGSKVRSINLGVIPNLESLNMGRCTNFVELHMPVECPKLKSLCLNGSKLSFLNLGQTPLIEKLYLVECTNLVKFHIPVECPKLKFLSLSGSKLSSLNLVMTPNLEILNISRCNNFVKLHMPIECPKLKSLHLNGLKLSNLNLGVTPHLETIDLAECIDFVELHMPIECLKLKSLDLSGSKVTNLNLGLTPRLSKLDLAQCTNFVKLHMPIECSNLTSLNLSGSKVTNLNLGLAPRLEKLDLAECIDFVELHMPVKCPHLRSLDLSGSKLKNLNLELTPCLRWLELNQCYDLQEIHAPVGCLQQLEYLNLCGCSRFEYIFFYKRLRHGSLYMVELSAESLHSCPLHPDNSLPKFQFKCFYKEPFISSNGAIEKLISSGLCPCTNLESFSAIICGLQNMIELTLEGSIAEVPKDLCRLESLEKLSLWTKEIRHLPDSICTLKHLKYLNVKSCWLLEQLPKELGQLDCLEKLILTECVQLRDIPDSICDLKSLTYLDLSYCILVEKLPAEFGRLECLNELDVEGSGISRLPQSVFQLKGLRIIGSRWRLESYGFTSLTDISRFTAWCYV